jgi:hypothetical protein
LKLKIKEALLLKHDIKYCGEQCIIGKAAQEKFLDQNNSAYDAVIDFWDFTENCVKTCPHKTTISKEA